LGQGLVQPNPSTQAPPKITHTSPAAQELQSLTTEVLAEPQKEDALSCRIKQKHSSPDAWQVTFPVWAQSFLPAQKGAEGGIEGAGHAGQVGQSGTVCWGFCLCRLRLAAATSPVSASGTKAISPPVRRPSMPRRDRMSRNERATASNCVVSILLFSIPRRNCVWREDGSRYRTTHEEDHSVGSGSITQFEQHDQSIPALWPGRFRVVRTDHDASSARRRAMN
jgi:hypothetical protein